MSKSNTALAVLTDVDIVELMKSSGQQTFTPVDNLPRLRINKDGEDDAGNTIPVGQFMVSQEGVAVFGKPVIFRALINAYQYSVYDTEQKKYTNRSIIFKQFSEEAIDELGGIACGKVSKKKMPENPSDAFLKTQKAIKCYRLVYGLASFDGVTASGEKTEVKELPVMMRLSGSNFMPIGAIFDDLSRKKKLMMDHNLTLNTKRQKFGTNVYYELLVDVDLENPVPRTKDNFEKHMDTVKLFQGTIDRENQSIAEKYRQAKKLFTGTAFDDMRVVKALDDDLRDEEPINL